MNIIVENTKWYASDMKFQFPTTGGVVLPASAPEGWRLLSASAGVRNRNATSSGPTYSQAVFSIAVERVVSDHERLSRLAAPSLTAVAHPPAAGWLGFGHFLLPPTYSQPSS
jgi:hypothetical protein